MSAVFGRGKITPRRALSSSSSGFDKAFSSPSLAYPPITSLAYPPITSPSRRARRSSSFFSMPRYKDEPPAIRVYTVCDESRYLIVKNVPSLGCGEELAKLFATYGDVEECKPMDAEDCLPYTDVYFIKFRLVCNARFAKRKLDEFAFLGNRLQVSYAPEFESLAETKEKLEFRRREVITRLNPRRSEPPTTHETGYQEMSPVDESSLQQNSNKKRDLGGVHPIIADASTSLPARVYSDQDYFASRSMNHTVRLVREKLDKIQSSGEHLQAAGSASKKARQDNRRRI